MHEGTELHEGHAAKGVSLARAGIRDHVVQAMELKFNCFLLMPVVDAFPRSALAPPKML